MSNFLDELARSLAKPMPRSRALRLIGSAVVTAAVPLARPGLPAGRAASRVTTGCGDPGTCATHDFPKVCGCDFYAGCYRDCCRTEDTCCKWSTGGQSPGHPPCEKACCPPGTVCGVRPGTCVCRRPCGNPERANRQCCGLDEHCSMDGRREGDPALGICCKVGRKGCGPNGSGGQHTFCCPPRYKCCREHGGVCCPELTKECDGAGGCKCLPGNTVRCGFDCCNPKTQKCCPAGAGGLKHCAPKNAVCCGRSWCKAGETCREGVCFKAAAK